MKPKSIYKYAAEAGLPVGLYLTLMSACMLMGLKISFLPMLLLPLAIGFPFLLWIIMRNIGRVEPSYMKFSSLWLGGIYSVIFGTIICLFLSALYVVNFEPGFFAAYVRQSIESIEATPMADDYAGTITLMKEALEAKILPSSLEFLTTMSWLTCFAGSILSFVLALLITKMSGKVSEAFDRR